MEKTRKRSFETLAHDAMEGCHAPGLALAVINETGDTIYQGLYGFRDEEKRLPVTENTIFGMASVTKSFTCLALLQLCEKGIMDLNAPVAEYLPELTDRRILVRHLMDHTAGFFPFRRMTLEEVATDIGLFGDGTTDLSENSRLADEGLSRVIERMNQVSVRLGAPGEYMSYSNDGYGLMSELVRKYGGEESFAAYIKRHILDPLGMKRSTMNFVAPFEDDDCASLYLNENGAHTKRNSYYHNAFVLHGGGALRSTLSDMKKYLLMYIHGKGLVLSHSIYEQMTTPGPVYDYRSRYCKAFAASQIDGHQIFAHNGSMTGISNRILWCPDMKMGVIAFCNKSGFPITTIANEALRVFGMGKFAQAPECVQGSRLSELGADADRIPGEYKSQEGAYCRLSADDGMLMVTCRIGGEPVPAHVLEDGFLAFDKPFATSYLQVLTLTNGMRAIRLGGRVLPKVSK